MKKIKLTQGKYAIIDDEDFDLVSKYKWHAAKIRHVFYATTNIRLNDKQTKLRMHSLIIGIKKGKDIDHINRNGLDNRKQNLRICSRSENNQNMKSFKGTSKYKGVYWHKRNKIWISRITINKKLTNLGSFKLEINAAKAYNDAALKYFGEFARLNIFKIINPNIKGA